MVSIGIAIYNVAEYLDECLESVLGQTYADWECILVNDGSTDRSEEICRIFTEKDRRFHLISQNNMGLSGARNTFLDKASGKYIFMIDGDDTLPSDSLAFCIGNIGDAQILSAGCHSISPYGKLIRRSFTDDMEYFIDSEALSAYMGRRIMSSVWSKIYDREVIGSIRFNPALAEGEDFIFNTEVMARAASRHRLKVAVAGHAIYHYRIRATSITHDRAAKRLPRITRQIEALNQLHDKYSPGMESSARAFANAMKYYFNFYYDVQGLWKDDDTGLRPHLKHWWRTLGDNGIEPGLELKTAYRIGNPVIRHLFISMWALPKSVMNLLRKIVKNILKR